MLKIVSQEEIGALVSDQAVITILLSRSMNAEFLRWLYSSWDEINRIAGKRWHIVVPSHSGDWLYTSGTMSVRDFNTALSTDIANSYGIRPDEFPCLLFEDFCEDAPPISISIPHDERERTKFVDDFAKLIADIERPPLLPWRWQKRRSVNAMIATGLRKKRLGSVAFRILPQVAGALAEFGFRRAAG